MITFLIFLNGFLLIFWLGAWAERKNAKSKKEQEKKDMEDFREDIRSVLKEFFTPK